MASAKERQFGPDLLRVFAVCLLFWLHFYLRNGFYNVEAKDLNDHMAIAFRPIFMCCVPLFATLTGYLKIHKVYEKGYYDSLVPILVSFTLISLIHLVYKTFLLKEAFVLSDRILEFFNFTLANYSWYVGMYIGLFLISPFFNTLWQVRMEQGFHRSILLTLFFLSFVPLTVNTLFEKSVVPSYFTQLSYLGYYAIGGYIRTYSPKISKLLSFISVLLLGFIQGEINIATRTEVNSYYSGYSASYGHLFICALTVLIFLALISTECNSKKIKKIFARISSVAFEMYLLSWLFDTRIYPLHKGEYGTKLYPVVGLAMTGAVFILSFLAALPVHALSKRISRVILISIQKKKGMESI